MAWAVRQVLLSEKERASVFFFGAIVCRLNVLI